MCLALRDQLDRLKRRRAKPRQVRSARTPFTLRYNERRRLHDHAFRAQQNDHREVVGVLLQDGKRRLKLQFLPNGANPGSWRIAVEDLRAARSHARKVGLRVVGLFHSHPLSEAALGKRDLQSTPLNWVHLVYDVCGREMKLWQVTRRNRRRVAQLVPFSFKPRTRQSSPSK